MELNLKQQARSLIDKAQRILIATRKDPRIDSIGSLLALGMVLEKMGKEVDLVCAGPILSIFSFLPQYDRISSKLKAKPNFVISLDTSKTEIASFSYDFSKDGKRLNIYITPKSGGYKPQDVSVENLSFEYDLICVLDTPNLETLGLVYEKNIDLFYNTPIINISNNPSNEYYGEVNLIDLTASSCCEILYSFIESIGLDYIDDNIATCLLAGLISSTSSFQAFNTTPKSLTCAAQLIALGADQQKIVQSLYKSKTFSYLKLLGRALARIKIEPDLKLVWTLLSLEDFEKTRAESQVFGDLLNELGLRVSESQLVLVLAEEKNGEISAWLKVNKNLDTVKLAEFFNTQLESDILKISFKNKKLLEAEENLIKKLKEFQKKYYSTIEKKF